MSNFPGILHSWSCMDRRLFLKWLSLASVGALQPLNISLGGIKTTRAAVSLAGVRRDSGKTARRQAVRDAALSATDFGWLSRGDSVLIKPALNSGQPFPATTSPDSIRAMVALLKEKGAGRVLVSDMSGIEYVRLGREKMKGSSRKLAERAGIAKAAMESGADLYFPEEEGWNAFFEDAPSTDAYWRRGIMIPKILNRVDHVVLMPRCARHALLGSTLGLKNVVGYMRTDSRLEYHKYAGSIQEKTADANTAPAIADRLRLTLTDATRILTTFGPDKGHVTTPDTGLVIASESIVAHDMASLAWLLINRRKLIEEGSFFSKIIDPYQRQIIVNNANRVVVILLGRLADGAKAEKLVRNDIETIWDDRVLNRAYQVFGGIPEVRLADANAAVPKDLKTWLDGLLKPSVDFDVDIQPF